MSRTPCLVGKGLIHKDVGRELHALSLEVCDVERSDTYQECDATSKPQKYHNHRLIQYALQRQVVLVRICLGGNPSQVSHTPILFAHVSSIVVVVHTVSEGWEGGGGYHGLANILFVGEAGKSENEKRVEVGVGQAVLLGTFTCCRYRSPYPNKVSGWWCQGPRV